MPVAAIPGALLGGGERLGDLPGTAVLGERENALIVRVEDTQPVSDEIDLMAAIVEPFDKDVALDNPTALPSQPDDPAEICRRVGEVAGLECVDEVVAKGQAEKQAMGDQQGLLAVGCEQALPRRDEKRQVADIGFDEPDFTPRIGSPRERQ